MYVEKQKNKQHSSHRKGKTPHLKKQTSSGMLQRKDEAPLEQIAPIQRSTTRSAKIAEAMGEKYQVDTSPIQFNESSSFPGKVGALATIQGNKIDFAPGQNTTANIKHEVAHYIDNAKNGTPKGDTVVNGHNVDTTREQVVDNMARKPI